MDDPKDVPVTVFVCGGKAAEQCQAGGEHDDEARVSFPGGESAACSKCGSTAYARDMLRLP